MVQAIAIAVVAIGIAVYLVLFFRGRKAGREIIDELETSQDADTAEPGNDEVPASPFTSVETSSTADDTALAHDTSVTKNVTFEDKVGGETVVVEVPSKDTRKRRVAKKEAPAVKKVAKKMKPVSTADLIKAIEEKIENRTALLKSLGINTETDATLKRYGKMRDALKAKSAAEKDTSAKNVARKTSTVKVRVVDEEVKTPAKKPAKKTAKKNTKTTTKKTTKKAKKSTK